MIPMTDYKVIYQNVIYNVLAILPFYNWNIEESKNELTQLEVMYLDEENRIVMIKDEVEEFQFIRK